VNFNATARPRRAFTLIEIMIVVAIMALVIATGLPAFVNMNRTDSMRGAVEGINEACASARARAILHGEPQTLTINLKDGSFSAPGADTARLPDDVKIEIIGVNFVDLMQEGMESASVRFFPNGTSDEFEVVLRSSRNEWRHIKLDVITALTMIESDPQKMTLK
jgi:prepilin-type N-terminal cleavage/methylation domain-containing protein